MSESTLASRNAVYSLNLINKLSLGSLDSFLDANTLKERNLCGLQYDIYNWMYVAVNIVIQILMQRKRGKSGETEFSM